MADTATIKSWLRLLLCEHVGPVAFAILLARFKTAEEALRHLPECARNGGLKKEVHLATQKQADEQLSLAEKAGARILLSIDPDYPHLLKQIDAAPPILFTRGNIALLNKKSLAVVGTRNASLNGRNLAKKLAFDLAKSGLNIVSGMARGIDAAAHMGALAAGGATTAVLGTAVDEIYPFENKELYQNLCQNGCVVSEFPFKTPLAPGNFPRRNRIISGLSVGTLVIEAQARSGSLITAQKALHQNRDVFAVPGSPVDPRSEGPNLLLKQGAILVRHAQDVLDELTEPITAQDILTEQINDFDPISDSDLDDIRRLVYENLNSDPVFIDDLARACNLPAAAVNIILVELELAGRLKRSAGSKVALTL